MSREAEPEAETRGPLLYGARVPDFSKKTELFPTSRPPTLQRHSQHEADRELVRRVLERRDDALEEFGKILQIVPGIVAANNRRLGRPLPDQDLEEVVQDALVVIWKKLATFEGRAQLRTWIYRVCTLELLNAARRRRREARNQTLTTEEEVLAEPSASGSEALGRIEQQELLEALDILRPREERVVHLKHYAGLTFEEIGQELGTTTNTSKGLYYRALHRLRTHLHFKLKDPRP